MKDGKVKSGLIESALRYYIPSECSTISWTLVLPLNSLASSRKPDGHGAGVRYCCRTGWQCNFCRFFPIASGGVFLSGHADWSDGEFITENRGRGNPVPRPAYHCRLMKSRVKQSSSSEPSVSMILSSCVWVSHSFATVSKASVNTSKPSGCRVRPAAMAWPPNWTISPGWRFANQIPAHRASEIPEWSGPNRGFCRPCPGQMPSLA